jgi:hypothetical protein
VGGLAGVEVRVENDARLGELNGRSRDSCEMAGMTRKESKYKRLPGHSFYPGSVRSLWQGADHLLWVEAVFFKERYKRFFYSDIQAIVLHRTEAHMFWSCIWGALAALCGLIAMLVSGIPYVSGTFTVIFLLALTVNLALGPACTVHLQTAVQIQKIACLKRVRTAVKALALIRMGAETAQGPYTQVPGGQARGAKADDLALLTPGVAPAATAQDRQAVADEAFNPLLHQVLFGLLLVLGALGAVQLLLKSLIVALLTTLLHGTILIMAIVCLARWYRQLKETLMAKINWLTLIFITLVTLAGYGLYIAAAFSHPQINYHHWEMFKAMFRLQMAEHPLALAANLIYAGGSLLLGIFGLPLAARYKVGEKTGPA